MLAAVLIKVVTLNAHTLLFRNECLGLAEQNLHPNDISYLICTHGHIDHIGNLNLFKNAKVILDHDVATKADIYEVLQVINLYCTLQCLLYNIWVITPVF